VTRPAEPASCQNECDAEDRGLSNANCRVAVRPDQQPDWHPRFGDRAQQLVFIGQQIDETSLRARLDACLLDEQLAAGDSKDWSELPNPFPELAVSDQAA
jgi:hypothetical protein